jgi:hypothetical protein
MVLPMSTLGGINQQYLNAIRIDKRGCTRGYSARIQEARAELGLNIRLWY